jgi:hypothetical protein
MHKVRRIAGAQTRRRHGHGLRDQKFIPNHSPQSRAFVAVQPINSNDKAILDLRASGYLLLIVGLFRAYSVVKDQIR